MKKILPFVLVATLLAIGYIPGGASSFVVVDDSEETASVQAYLFLSNSCPWCRKLKQENFPAQFRKKYARRVNLKEYEIHTAEGRQQFSKLTKKHGLSGGVPVLIVGDAVLQGYSADLMARADEAVRKESKKAHPVKKSAKKKGKELPPVISITMEDEELQGVAPAQDLEQMKQYLAHAQDENGETLGSINRAFNADVSTLAMAIVNDHEQKLKDLAAKSPSFVSFKKSAVAVKASQEKQLNELMRKNTKSLR